MVWGAHELLLVLQIFGLNVGMLKSKVVGNEKITAGKQRKK